MISIDGKMTGYTDDERGLRIAILETSGRIARDDFEHDPEVSYYCIEVRSERLGRSVCVDRHGVAGEVVA